MSDVYVIASTAVVGYEMFVDNSAAAGSSGQGGRVIRVDIFGVTAGVAAALGASPDWVSIHFHHLRGVGSTVVE
jgi:hypothetical protein